MPLWHRLPVSSRDLPLGLLLLVASALPGFRGNGTSVGDVATRPLDALAAAALALECLPLALRRRSPALGLALVSLGFCLDQLRGYHTFAGTALPIALLSAGAHLHRHRRGTAVLFSVAYVPLAVTLAHTGRGGERASGFVTFYLALALAWGVGAWLRADRATEAERRRRVADDTRAEERTRIARELHDIVTHHVTAMVVQAEAARYLTAVPERLDETLSAVTDTGRQAITDLRHLLDLLEPSHGPGRSTGRGAEPRTPAAGALRTLVEQARRAGQPVEFTEEGTPAVSAGSADLVAYRVVQEALTNALKYDHGGLTTVRVRHTDKEITVDIGTDGTGSPAASPGGGGRGLAGLRARVDVLGGDFDAGARAGGGFAVRARIPVGGAA
ncbi:histidine kinase [Streptomyces sp. SID8499]|uniref:histidine kinase n=1 Tax=Streptomyces sp. SID8499 TaxID=2706106 RepID=UPI0013C58A34|nr:two-component sensor histidine kinase [Streptomyces sp. SID8499]